MKTPVTLAALRRAISDYSRASFCYEGVSISADLYLLGTAKKTGAYVLLAWCADAGLGWQRFRFAQMKDFRVLGRFESVRDDYTATDPEIITLDTFLPALRRRQPVH